LKGKNPASDPFAVVGVNNPATIALAPRGTPLYDTTYGNVAPRTGLAYQLRQAANSSTVLRAGFGMFYDLGQGTLGGATGSFPFSASRSLSFVPFPLSPQNAAPPAITTNPPVPNIVVADRHLKLPRTYQWNVALEQSLGTSQSLSLTYIGAIGRNLLRVTNLFNPNPYFQFVSLTSNTATSDYHALQLKFQRRLSRGLQALASYSFSHSIDIASTDSSANSVNTPGAITNPNIDRGNSDFDIRHSFTAGVTYDLPAPGSQKVVRSLFGGWSLDSFILARSAPPLDVVTGTVFAGGVPKIVDTESNSFDVTAELIAANVTSKTKLLILNSPNNPTGGVIPPDEYQRILAVCKKHNVWLMSDECYSHFTYEPHKPYSIASVADSKEHIVIIGSMSKTFAMTGWRIGYTLAPEALVQATVKLQSQSTSNPTSIAQHAALEAMRGSMDSVPTMLAEYARRRRRIVDGLRAIPGVTCEDPGGAFYAFPNVAAHLANGTAGSALAKNTTELAKLLLDKARVALVPGDAFGAPGYLRLSYATSIERIDEGLRRLQRFFTRAEAAA